MSQILSSVLRGHLPLILLISGTDKQGTKILSSVTFYYFSVPWSTRKLRPFSLQFYEYACPTVHTVVFCCFASLLLPTWKIRISTLLLLFFFSIWLLMLKRNLFTIWLSLDHFMKEPLIKDEKQVQILYFGYCCSVIVSNCCHLRCTAGNAVSTFKGLTSFASPDSRHKEQKCYDRGHHQHMTYLQKRTVNELLSVLDPLK